jgi:DNA-directed RNA polymerase specialized sigma24 family protein
MPNTENPSAVILERMKFNSKISCLGLEDRMVALLVFWEDADVHQIATACECTVDTAYKKIQRVKRKIREEYAHE